MKRADWLLLKKGKFERDKLIALCQLPLVCQVLEDRLLDFSKDDVVLDVLLKPLDDVEQFMKDTMGLDFLVLQTHESKKGNADLTVYFHIKITNKIINVQPLTIGHLNDFEDTTVVIKRSTGDTKYLSTKNHWDRKQTRKFVEHLTSHIAELVWFVKQAMENSLHPVSVFQPTPLKNQKGHRPHIEHDRKPWMRGDLTSVVFLDKLPTTKEAKPSQGGSHASPIYHQRKGHFRTMRDEKFKNHPDFKKPIWRKSTWVGEPMVEVGGTTYKVLGV